MRAKHEVERTRFGEIRRAAVRTLHTLGANGGDDIGAARRQVELVSTQSRVALATVNQRITERIFVSRILPNQPIENDRRIKALDIIALVNHPAPPGYA